MRRKREFKENFHLKEFVRQQLNGADSFSLIRKKRLNLIEVNLKYKHAI